MKPKIVKCEIIVGGHWEANRVHVWYEDGTDEIVVTYYPDELHFSESEFIGLTRDQAVNLHTKKDVAYLRS